MVVDEMSSWRNDLAPSVGDKAGDLMDGEIAFVLDILFSLPCFQFLPRLGSQHFIFLLS